MSLFKGEALPDVKTISFSAVSTPVNKPITGFWYDYAQSGLSGQVAGTSAAPELLAYVNATPVNVTNSTAATTLMTAPLSLQWANAVGKTIFVTANGTYTTNAGQTPTIQLQVTMGGVNVLSWTSGATTASKTGPWEVSGWVVVVNNGANANVEAHGNLCITLGATNTAATTTYLDINTAVSANINLQANANVAVVGTMSTSDATTSINQRMLIVEIAN